MTGCPFCHAEYQPGSMGLAKHLQDCEEKERFNRMLEGRIRERAAAGDTSATLPPPLRPDGSGGATNG